MGLDGALCINLSLPDSSVDDLRSILSQFAGSLQFLKAQSLFQIARENILCPVLTKNCISLNQSQWRNIISEEIITYCSTVKRIAALARCEATIQHYENQHQSCLHKGIMHFGPSI